MQPTCRPAALLVALLACAATARAEVTACVPIPSLPVIISAPGIYCLKDSLSVAGDGVRIDADDVVLDLNGHTISGDGTKTGVQASDRRNITIRNGTIREFVWGVRLESSGKSAGHVIEDLRVEDISSVAIEADGRGIIVRNNLVTGTGGSAVSGVFAIGIFINTGSGAHVHDNQIVDMRASRDGEADGIRVFKAPGSAVQRNVISSTSSPGSISYGIAFLGSPGSTAVGNRIYNMVNGIRFFAGAAGMYMDNTVGGAATPFSGGTAAGATNFSF
jgi:hypothetical protein